MALLPVQREQEAQAQTFQRILRETMDDSQLRVFFTEDRAMRLILESRADRRSIDRVGFAGSPPDDLFGWTTQHRFLDKYLHFSFKKVIRGRSAFDMMARNWANELKFATYRSASEAATQRFYVRCTFACSRAVLVGMLTRSRLQCRWCRRSTRTRT